MAARKDYAQRPKFEPIDTSVLTLDGKAIPAEVAHLIPYQNTDQGIAEANARKIEEGRVNPSSPRVTVEASEWDKKLQRFGDDDTSGLQPWETADPIQAAIQQVPDRVGKAFHLLGDSTVNRNGMRGYAPARDRNGSVVTVGNMALAYMPKDLADQRERHYANLSKEAIGHEKDKAVAEQKQYESEADPKVSVTQRVSLRDLTTPGQ